jgi:CheY-like chemotaxis protein
LIQRILAFGRKDTQARQVTSIPRVVDEALELLRPSLPSNVEISSTIDPTVAPVLADPIQMHQIVMNLCTNAYQSMGHHGGRLKIVVEGASQMEAAARGLSGADRYAKLIVADNGCGMDELTLSRIFDPFFTTKGQDKGTGLGLSVVHGIVARMDGAIHADSEVDKGSTFAIYLPCCEAEEAPLSKDSTASGKARGSETLLLVDDEETIGIIAEALLTNLGYEVLIASSGEDALRIVQADPSRVDLMITDHTMPGILGSDLAAMVKEIAPGLPIVLMSGAGAQEQPAIDRFVAKPFEFSEVAVTVRELLDHSPRATEARSN